jgi:hypothetical protein
MAREENRLLRELDLMRSGLDNAELGDSLDIFASEQKEDFIKLMTEMHEHVKRFLAPSEIVEDPDWRVKELSTRYDLL